MTQQLLPSLEVAGMINSRGRVGRQVETGGVLRPDGAFVRLDRKKQTLIYDTRATLIQDVQRPELLDEFIRLDGASAEQILKFAKAYGVLSVRALQQEGAFAEDVNAWRECVRRARATLAIAACMHIGEATSARDWDVLRPWWCDRWKEFIKPRQAERNQLAEVLNAWLRVADVRPSVAWTKASTRIVFTNLEDSDVGQVTMLGALALQMVRAVGRARLIETCSGCARIYLRERQAQAGRENYCSKCGVRAAWRDAQARRRAGLKTKMRCGVQRGRKGGAK